MIVLLRTILLLVTLVVFASRAGAQIANADGTGNEFYLGCKEYAGQKSPTSSEMELKGNRCAAVAWALAFVSNYLNTVPELKSCVPHNADVPQMVRVVVKFLDDNPNLANEFFPTIVLTAFHRAWPCN